MNIIAQIFGVGAMLSLFLLYQQKNRKKLIFSKLCADVCWVIHYFLLKGYGGMIPNLVGIFREIVFSKREEKKWADKIFWPFLFIILGWTIGIFTFKSPINILPIAASTFVTVSLWVKNPRLTKIISIPVCASFLIYDVFIGSYVGILNESISIFSIIISFLRESKTKKENGNAT